MSREKRLELLYFPGCPHLETARQALRACGREDFSEVNLDLLPEAHAYRNFSSPSVLCEGELLLGSVTGGSACSIVDWNAAAATLRARISGN